MFYFYIVVVFILSGTLARGMENSSCPESKKQYPGDCRLFYKCVPLSQSAHAYVWVPSRCSAGLVFHPTLKKCIFSKTIPSCQSSEDDDPSELSYLKNIQDLQYQDDVDVISDDMLEVDELDSVTAVPETTETISGDNSFNVLNALDQDRVPLSVVDNVPMDKIKNQMSILTELINSYKTSTYFHRPVSSTNYVEVTPLKYSAVPLTLTHNPISSQNSVVSYFNSPQLKPNFLKTQLNKITTQLVMPKPIPNRQKSKLHLNDSHVLSKTEEDPSVLFEDKEYNYTNPQNIVTVLFQKYLSNNYDFMENGEYTRKDAVVIPVTTRKSPVPTKPPYDLINQIRKDHLTSSKNRTSFSNNSNKANGFYNKSCLNSTRLPNFDDCARYFLCNSSTNILQSYTCPPYTAFSKLKLMCDVAEYQTCRNQYTESSQIETTQVYNKVHCDTYMCGGLQNFKNNKQSFVDLNFIKS